MTEIDIINKALLKLGQSPINNLGDDNERALAGSALYESVRDTEISTHRWCFAMKRVLLEECSTVPAFEYKKQYPLPTDFLRLLYLPDAPDNIENDYSIEGTHILTDYQSPLKVVYLARITTPNLFPSYFVEALAVKIAYELCERLKQDPARKQQLTQEYAFVISQAKKANQIQMAAQRMPMAGYIEARFGY